MEDEDQMHRLANYTGDIKNGRMEGTGTYWFDTETRYEGEFKDGMFHGQGTLFFPDGGLYKTSWCNGRDMGGNYMFKDGLDFENDDRTLTGWRFCNRVWDRRFYKEITDGLRPVDRCMMSAQSSETGTPNHHIPDNCYDTGDGYYNPVERVVYNYAEKEGRANKFVRNVTDDEHEWIVKKCRRGCDRFVGLQRIDDYSDVTRLSRQVGRMALEKAGDFAQGLKVKRERDERDKPKRVSFQINDD